MSQTYEELLAEWHTDPEFHAYSDDLKRKEARAEALFGWTRKIPVLGQLTWVFWSCLVTEGLRSTVKPRWGALTFAFLNDGYKPTLWHTWHSVIRPNGSEFTGTYPGGAPRSRAEAQRWEDQWAKEREQNKERDARDLNEIIKNSLELSRPTINRGGFLGDHAVYVSLEEMNKRSTPTRDELGH